MFDLIALAMLQSVFIAPPELALIVLEPHFDGRPATRDDLTKDTESILGDLQRAGQLRYRRTHLAGDAMFDCLKFGPEPSDERLTCVRQSLPATEAGYPAIAILVGYTGERGAWQRMECIGSRSNGIQRHVYVNEVRHPSVDLSKRARSQVLQCVQDALKLGTSKRNAD